MDIGRAAAWGTIVTRYAMAKRAPVIGIDPVFLEEFGARKTIDLTVYPATFENCIEIG
jgi:hypothetical protein